MVVSGRSCRSHHGVDPGTHGTTPIDKKKLANVDVCPHTGPYFFCNYCTQIHKDSHQQGLYPLPPDRLGPNAYCVVNHVSPSAPAGKPSDLWIAG